MFAKFVTNVSRQTTTAALESLDGVYTVNEIRDMCVRENCKAILFDEHGRKRNYVYENGNMVSVF